MRKVARVLAGAVALTYLVFGARFVFTPDALLSTAGFEQVSLVGMANVRALLGGSFLAFGILLMIHTAIKQETGALRFTILHLLVMLVARMVSLGVDGSAPGVLRNLAPASIMFVVCVVALKLFQKSDEPMAEERREPALG